MSEPLLNRDQEEEAEYYGQKVANSGYVDVFASSYEGGYSVRPLSNGLLFLVLSLADWERERVALMRLREQRRYINDEDESDVEEDELEDLPFKVQTVVNKILSCFRL